MGEKNNTHTNENPIGHDHKKRQQNASNNVWEQRAAHIHMGH
jgi:hypothetical protein